VERVQVHKIRKNEKDVSGGGKVQVHKIRKNEKDVSGGGKVQVHKIRKNEKRRFRRWKGFKFIKSEK
jgi:hypothetical protein